MKSSRNNWPFLLLLAVTVILLLMLLNLQSVLVSQQTGAIPSDAGPFYAVRRQLAQMIAPASFTPTPTATLTPVPPTATSTATSTSTSTPTSTATPTPLPTATAVALPLPTETPLPTPTLLPLPTDTPIPLPTPLPTDIPPTAIPATATQEAPSPTPTETSAPAVEPADYRLGFVERNDQCGGITEIVKLILEQNLSFQVASVAFPNTDALYAALAGSDLHSRVDLTLCYADPDDRAYLQKHLGFVLLVGSGYRKLDGKNYLVLSNAAVKKVIQHDQPCVYSLLTSLDLTDVDLVSQDAQSWYAANTDRVRSWTECQ